MLILEAFYYVFISLASLAIDYKAIMLPFPIVLLVLQSCITSFYVWLFKYENKMTQ